MIERRQLAHPGWRLEAPAWARRLFQGTAATARREVEETHAERTVKNAARMQRACGIRVDAERRFFGLPDR